MLRGLMIKHQRVQIAPVAIRAAFWVRDSFSAGRLKSEIPAMTRAHCSIMFRQQRLLKGIQVQPESIVCHKNKIAAVRQALSNHGARESYRTFITGALQSQEHQQASSEVNKIWHKRSHVLPEMHSLHTNRAVPHALKGTLLLRGAGLGALEAEALGTRPAE